MSLKNPPDAKIYLRFTDQGDGTVAIKLVSDPHKSEWDPDNLSPAMILAMVALGGAMDSGEVVTVSTQKPTKGEN